MTEKRGYRSVILALTLMTASATGSEQVTFIAADGTPIEAEIDYLMIAGDSDGFPPDSPENRVIPNTTDTPFAGVGSLQLFSPEFGHSMCTATPITPRHILTAAHCAARVPMCGMLFILNFGADRSHLIRISAITLHPDTNRARLSVFDDLAVLTLSEPLPPELPIYPIFPDRLFSGDTVTMVGYGWPGDGVTGFRFPGNSDPTIKRWGANVVDTVLLDEAPTADADDDAGMLPLNCESMAVILISFLSWPPRACTAALLLSTAFFQTLVLYCIASCFFRTLLVCEILARALRGSSVAGKFFHDPVP